MKRASQTARAAATTTVVRVPTVIPDFPPITSLDPEAAKQVFKAVVLDIGAARLAKAAHVSKESARLYKQGRKFPSGPRLISMARDLPEVKAWLYHEVEREDDGFDSDRTLTGSMERVIALAATPGKKGDAARKMLADMAKLAAETRQ